MRPAAGQTRIGPRSICAPVRHSLLFKTRHINMRVEIKSVYRKKVIRLGCSARKTRDRHLVSEFPRSSRLTPATGKENICVRANPSARTRKERYTVEKCHIADGDSPHPLIRPPLKIPTLTRVPPTLKGNAGMAARLLGFGTTRRRSMPTSKVCCYLGYTSCASACDCRASSSGQRHRREHRGAGTRADGRA
jgi:hypothetical protein